MSEQQSLDALGSGPQAAHGPEGLEAFPCSRLVRAIELTTAELVCKCPITGQPDIYQASIRYGVNADRPKALETKSVKLWLWSYGSREPGVFAEDIAAELARDVMLSPASPEWVDVVLVQNPRGGITTTVHASEGDPPT